MKRRDALKLIATGVAGIGLEADAAVFPFSGSHWYKPSAPEDALLAEMTQTGVRFFWDEASEKTGQVRDRALAQTVDFHGRESRKTSSIAATGFGLTALCIADWRGYLPHNDIHQRVLKTLQYHWEQLPHEHGFYYHWNDMETGARMNKCELSSIDTAIFICGAITARQYFRDVPVVGSQIAELATKLYERVNWPWMLNKDMQFSMGWTPEFNFLAVRWEHYCELMMLLLLSIGSRTHPIAPRYWDNFRRPEVRYQNYRFIGGPDPLFTHQYSHAWFDFRGKRDRYANYFDNSTTATRAHKAYCLSMKKWYNDSYWGVTASDSRRGYQAWGGPPEMGHIDGSVVPCAAAGSLVFTPQDSLKVLMNLRKKYGRQAWGKYGFTDAFYPAANWYNEDVLGIDQGISVIMAENLRTGIIWQHFMQAPEVKLAMTLTGFQAEPAKWWDLNARSSGESM